MPFFGMFKTIDYRRSLYEAELFTYNLNSIDIYLQIILEVTPSTQALPITALAQHLMINRGSNTSDPDTIRTEWFFTFITLILWLYRKQSFTLLTFLQQDQLPVEQHGGLHHVLELRHVYPWGGVSLDTLSSGSEVIFPAWFSCTFKVQK